jgi:hypothetical protein
MEIFARKSSFSATNLYYSENVKFAYLRNLHMKSSCKFAYRTVVMQNLHMATCVLRQPPYQQCASSMGRGRVVQCGSKILENFFFVFRLIIFLAKKS